MNSQRNEKAPPISVAMRQVWPGMLQEALTLRKRTALEAFSSEVRWTARPELRNQTDLSYTCIYRFECSVLHLTSHFSKTGCLSTEQTFLCGFTFSVRLVFDVLLTALSEVQQGSRRMEKKSSQNTSHHTLYLLR